MWYATRRALVQQKDLHTPHSSTFTPAEAASTTRSALKTGAFDLLQRADQVAWQYTIPPLSEAHLAAQWVSFWLARGHVADAARFARERGLSVQDEPCYPREAEQIALVRLLVAEGKLDSALQLSDRLLAAAKDAGRISRLIKILVLQALAFQEQGDGDRAAASILTARFRPRIQLPDTTFGPSQP